MPRSPKRRPEPATKSFTVLDTKTSSVSASAATRAPICGVATNNEYGGSFCLLKIGRLNQVDLVGGQTLGKPC